MTLRKKSCKKNLPWKRENAGKQQFLLFQPMFPQECFQNAFFSGASKAVIVR